MEGSEGNYYMVMELPRGEGYTAMSLAGDYYYGIPANSLEAYLERVGHTIGQVYSAEDYVLQLVKK